MTENQTRMKEIEELLTKYKGGISQEQSEELMGKIRDARFIVPVTFPKDETLAAMQAELARTGQPVRIPKDAKPIPILIQNPNKEQFLAVYTSFAQLPKEGDVTSNTQWSALYNDTDLTLDLVLRLDWDVVTSYSLTENAIR